MEQNKFTLKLITIVLAFYLLMVALLLPFRVNVVHAQTASYPQCETSGFSKSFIQDIQAELTAQVPQHYTSDWSNTQYYLEWGTDFSTAYPQYVARFVAFRPNIAHTTAWIEDPTDPSKPKLYVTAPTPGVRGYGYFIYPNGSKGNVFTTSGGTEAIFSVSGCISAYGNFTNTNGSYEPYKPYISPYPNSAAVPQLLTKAKAGDMWSSIWTWITNNIIGTILVMAGIIGMIITLRAVNKAKDNGKVQVR